jgi:hypothetical protein
MTKRLVSLKLKPDECLAMAIFEKVRIKDPLILPPASAHLFLLPLPGSFFPPGASLQSRPGLIQIIFLIWLPNSDRIPDPKDTAGSDNFPSRGGMEERYLPPPHRAKFIFRSSHSSCRYHADSSLPINERPETTPERRKTWPQ